MRHSSLREKAIKGGAFLLMRQVIGIGISVVGVLMVTRIIGPRQYGLYAAGAGIITFVYTFGIWGLDAYLLRKSEDPAEKEFQQTFTLLVLIATALCITIIILRHFLAALLKMPEESSLLFVFALAIPLNLLTVPPVVKLDRDLNFKQVAQNELLSQIGYYLVAIPLAFQGAGAWAPAAGFLCREAGLLALSYRAARFRPRLRWEGQSIKPMLRYGLSFSGSIWVYQLRRLVNPVIVGRFAGAEAVGYVAVCVRIVEMISFAASATWRLAMPAFAKLNGDAVRLRNAITEGMRFQAASVGFPLAAFALLVPWLIPLGFGRHWAPSVSVFPLIAIAYVSNVIFNLHSSVLYVLQKNTEVTFFHIVHIVIFAASAMVLVPTIGFVGYGYAEVISVGSNVVVDCFLAKAVGRPTYIAPGIWLAACVVAIALGMAITPARYVGFLVLCTPFLFRKERSILAGYAQILFSRVSV